MGRQRVDRPEKVNPQDNPQTDTRKWPSTLEVTLNGQRITRVNLADDPADARGVLSHLVRSQHGRIVRTGKSRVLHPNQVEIRLAAE